ncbi:MAG: flap endonuclease-1 [Candidatus Odinarchaeia archaeon]
MGVNIKDIITSTKISFDKLAHKQIAIDAYNTIYQFLANIRQFDGKPLVDRKGFITSHLSGLFYRTINLMEEKIKPVYVFDGEPPKLKNETITKRIEIRKNSERKWRDALEKGEYEEAKKYAQASSRLSEEMVEEAKKLISYMGVPIIQAPSEGEAQAAYMNLQGDVWACASQDWDSLLFGAPRLIRNLTITGKRKIPKKQVYIKIEPEIIVLDEVLKVHNLTREQLVELAILIGTDYNTGIKGIGAKTALKLIKKHHDLKTIIKEEKIELNCDYEEIKQIFLNPKIKIGYTLSWNKPQTEKIIELLHEQHDFSIERVNKALERLTKIFEESKKPTLDSWFK